LLGLVGLVLFVLFMKKLAEYIGHRDLAARARNVLIGFVITLSVGVVMVVSGMIGQIVLGIPFVIAAVVALVMYANLVNWLRKALRGR
jgi:hypothetical protein